LTPLQSKIRKLIHDHNRANDCSLSDRDVSALVGKSQNLLSQIMNDGLVPSGEVLLLLGEALGANEEERRELVMAAMRAKAESRSRDTFWLQHALELTDSLVSRVDEMKRFLESQGQLDAFEQWLGVKPPSSGSSKTEHSGSS
jgi:transcriptional regulator with XRE-family HTH domain